MAQHALHPSPRTDGFRQGRLSGRCALVVVVRTFDRPRPRSMAGSRHSPHPPPPIRSPPWQVALPSWQVAPRTGRTAKCHYRAALRTVVPIAKGRGPCGNRSRLRPRQSPAGGTDSLYVS